MDRDQTRAALRASLARWQRQAEDDSSTGIEVAASLQHVEVFALASLAQELHEIALTLQARHEEAMDRGSPAFPPSGRTLRVEHNGDECGALPTATARPERRCRLPLGHAGGHRWGDLG